MKTFKYYYSILATLFSLLSLNSIVSAQTQLSTRDLQVDILRLGEYSIKYDAYHRVFPNSDPQNEQKYEKKYKDQIQKIKNGINKNQYLAFLDKAIGTDSLKHKNQIGYNYTYYNELLTHDRRKMPNRLEYFKVVKYSLFTLNRDELVLPKDVPFLRPESK